MAKQEVSFINFANPETDFSKGGFFNDGLYRWEECRFVIFDFNGKGDPRTCLRITLQPVKKGKKGFEKDGDPSVQYWSVADPKFFEPSDDECHLVATGEKATLAQGSNFFFFWNKAIEAGLDNTKYDNDISSLDGTIAYMHQVPEPEGRAGFRSSVAPSGGQQNDRPKTVIVPKSIETQGGGGSKPAAASKNGKAPAAAPKTSKKEEAAEESEGGGLGEYLAEIVTIDANKKGIKKAVARMRLMKKFQADSLDKDAVKELVDAFNDDDTLTEALAELGWELDGDTIKEG